MKKVLLMLALLPIFLFTSCSDDDDPASTSYTFNWELEDYSMITTNVILFEYSADGEKVANNTIECHQGLSKVFTANEKTEKVKVYVKMEGGSQTTIRWVQQVYYLQKGKTLTLLLMEKLLLERKSRNFEGKAKLYLAFN